MNGSGFFISVEKDFEATKKRCADILTIDDSGRQYDFVEYMLEGQGKGVRPMLTLLSAAMFGDVNDDSVSNAAILELTHNASLIHDDVVDEAYQRRGKHSVNALWGSKRAVLIGDYILSRAIKAASDNELQYAIADVARVIEEMSIGEIEQIDATRKLDMTESRYYDVIRRKTANLMGCCARLGARSTGASEIEYTKMEKFGVLIGMMFQVKDDILDYTGVDTGKHIGNDVKERKITLPLIYAIQRATKSEKDAVLSMIRKDNESDITTKKVYDFILKNGGIEMAECRMAEFKSEALAIIENFEKTTATDNMIEFVNFVAERKK